MACAFVATSYGPVLVVAAWEFHFFWLSGSRKLFLTKISSLSKVFDAFQWAFAEKSWLVMFGETWVDVPVHR